MGIYGGIKQPCLKSQQHELLLGRFGGFVGAWPGIGGFEVEAEVFLYLVAYANKQPMTQGIAHWLLTVSVALFWSVGLTFGCRLLEGRELVAGFIDSGNFRKLLHIYIKTLGIIDLRDKVDIR